MAFASQETVQVLATKEELDALESAYEEDVSNSKIMNREWWRESIGHEADVDRSEEGNIWSMSVRYLLDYRLH